MRLSSKQLLLVVNPFAAPLGADGCAMALCPADPAEPSGSPYVGARTIAASLKRSKAEEARMRSPFGPRDKVSAMYDLKPRAFADTSYYRAKVKSGEVFLIGEPGAVSVTGAISEVLAALRSAARLQLAAFVSTGGDRAKALASWRAQGLAKIADMIEQRTSSKLPPGSDELREAPARPTLGGLPFPPGSAIEAKPGETVTLATEGAVS